MSKILKMIIAIGFIVLVIISLAMVARFYPDVFLLLVSFVFPFVFIFLSLALVWFLMGKKGSFRVTYFFIKRRWHVFLSYKFQLVFGVMSLLVMLLLYYVVGKPFVDVMFASMSGGLLNYGGAGYDFVTFIVIGMIGFPMLWSGYSISAANIRSEQYTGMFEVMIPTKYGVQVLPFASLLSGIVNSLLMMVASLLLVVYLFGIDLKLGNPVALIGVVCIILLSVLTMWGFGLILGGLTTVYKQLGPFEKMLRVVMMFFCGVYIPIQILPVYVQPISYALPLTYAFRSLRAAMVSGQGMTTYWMDVTILFCFSLVMISGGYIVFNRLLNKARKAGTIYGY